MKILQHPDALWEALFDTSAEGWSRKDFQEEEKKSESGKSTKGK
jgi:hypothetical protein